MPLTIKKERCRAKAKAKAKAIWTSFFGLDVFFGVAISFYLSTKIGLFFFPSFGQWQLIRIGPNVVSRSRLVVTQSWTDPATSQGSVFPD
jgi:hypothetical protein